ncbi:hypothetical protein F7725_024310 [Dissostichus mawsoni]|uniref:Mini-chromosome maintenance complex-binding protein n=1 Tax=Dissostichus mawsoni TaxID=36200 RepID=A0A7J5Y0J7_DISMA|nr:hypothetical protein F7725_024310 [Dissostichus mawsoni]
MCEAGGATGAMPILLGTETGPADVGAAERAGGGHGAWPMAANGSLLVEGLENGQQCLPYMTGLTTLSVLLKGCSNNPSSGWEAKAVEFFKDHLKEKDAQTWVPSLNDVPLHYMKPNSLVKFRCLIQDMFDPEFYMGAYEAVDPSTKAKVSASLSPVQIFAITILSCVQFFALIMCWMSSHFHLILLSGYPQVLKCGKYKDVMECGVDFNSKNTVTAERQTFYCVPIPGESPWVKEISLFVQIVRFGLLFFAGPNNYASSSQARVVPSTSYAPTRQKRSYEEDDDMDTQPQPQKQREQHTGLQSPTEHHGNGECKRRETEAPSNQTAPASHLDLNFPLPGEKGPSCLVKVYAEWDGFKLNDTLEVYGILSVSPALSALADEKDVSSSFLDPTDSMETAEEQRVHCPPASLVPRLHMLYAKPLPHNNPLLPATLEDNSAFLSSTLSEMAAVRADLLTYFTHILLGDALAAEYLILHLISNVYSRRDLLPLGKFSLNLSGCPTVSSYTERLYQVIQQLVPSSFYLAMSLQNMNQMKFVPKKDYVANRLVSGALQLAKHTSLFLDEIQLEQGQLDTTGVHNITALGNLISWQKVDYDFNYHQMEFPCNINVLTASEGRSLLPSDCQIHLQSQVAPPTWRSI